MGVLLEIHNAANWSGVPRAALKKAAECTLRAVRRKGTPQIHVAFVGPAEARRLNATYRKRKYVPSVLAFAWSRETDEKAAALPQEVLGEILIAPGKAKQEVAASGYATLRRYVTFLFIHGLLHLLGYEHDAGERRARKMEALERRIVQETFGGTRKVRS